MAPYDQVCVPFELLCQIYDQEFTSTKLWPAMYDQTTTKWPPAYDQMFPWPILWPILCYDQSRDQWYKWAFDQYFLDQSCDQCHAMISSYVGIILQCHAMILCYVGIGMQLFSNLLYLSVQYRSRYSFCNLFYIYLYYVHPFSNTSSPPLAMCTAFVNHPPPTGQCPSPRRCAINPDSCLPLHTPQPHQHCSIVHPRALDPSQINPVRRGVPDSLPRWRDAIAFLRITLPKMKRQKCTNKHPTHAIT